ncbi:amidohydrolase [Kordiimonas sp. SCSIO 12610]|nr:amidohydrolase [Kordiimonas sp. SCSIO 12610]
MSSCLIAEENSVTSRIENPPVDLIVYGDYVLTMENLDSANNGIIEKGAIAVSGGKIVAVGPASEIEISYDAIKTISGDGRILMPGLINGHTHSAMTLLRGFADDLPLMEWLQTYIFPMEGRFVDKEFVEIGMRLACLEMIKGGTTTFADMYFYPKTAVDTVDECGMRAIIGAPMIDFPSPGFGGWDDSMKAGVQFVQDMKAKAHPRITPAFAPHAPYTVSPEHLAEVLKAAKDEGVPILMHVAESPTEVEDIKNRYGKRPVTHVADIGMLDHPMAAAHVVHPDEDEIKMLAGSKIGAVHNPTSNMKLASGVAPVPAMIEAGVKVGLGTDGAASNNDLNMWEEMRMAALLHKVTSGDPTAMPAGDVLRMATSLGAAALDMEDDIGTLAVGKRADMIQLTVDRPHLTPLYNVISHLVYAANAADVVTNIIEGKVLMEDGKVTILDEASVIEAANKKASEIKAALAER